MGECQRAREATPWPERPSPQGGERKAQLGGSASVSTREADAVGPAALPRRGKSQKHDSADGKESTSGAHY